MMIWLGLFVDLAMTWSRPLTLYIYFAVRCQASDGFVLTTIERTFKLGWIGLSRTELSNPDEELPESPNPGSALVTSGDVWADCCFSFGDLVLVRARRQYFSSRCRRDLTWRRWAEQRRWRFVKKELVRCVHDVVRHTEMTRNACGCQEF